MSAEIYEILRLTRSDGAGYLKSEFTHLHPSLGYLTRQSGLIYNLRFYGNYTRGEIGELNISSMNLRELILWRGDGDLKKFILDDVNISDLNRYQTNITIDEMNIINSVVNLCSIIKKINTLKITNSICKFSPTVGTLGALGVLTPILTMNTTFKIKFKI